MTAPTRAGARLDEIEARLAEGIPTHPDVARDTRWLITRVRELEAVSQWPGLIRRLVEQQERIVELEVKVGALEERARESDGRVGGGGA